MPTFRTHYRCTSMHCRKRYSFKRPLEQYKVRPPQLSKTWGCGVCGGNLSEKTAAVKRHHKTAVAKGRCNCGLPGHAKTYPHVEGSIAECIMSEDFRGGFA